MKSKIEGWAQKDIDLYLNTLDKKKWRIEYLYKIRDKQRKTVNLVLNPLQYLFWNASTNRDIILKARKIGFCGSPDMRVLTSDLKWVLLKNIQIGQEIIATDEFAKKGRGNDRKLRTAIIQNKRVVSEIAYKLTMDDGRVLIFTPNHRLLSKRPSATDTIWKQVKDFNVGDPIRYITKPWSHGTFEDGWFGGLIDGEGCLQYKKHSGVEINVSQRPSKLFNNMIRYAIANGYHYNLEINKRQNTDYAPCQKIVFSRIDEVFRLIGQTRPQRFIGIKWWEDKSCPGKKSTIGWSKIIAIEKLEQQEMIDLQTSTKTFIVEGFVSHNSTFCLIDALDDAIWYENFTAFIMAHRREDVQKLFQIIHFAYDNMLEPVKPKAEYYNKNELFFKDRNSRIYVGTEARSDVINRLHVSEAAFIENAEKKLAASFEAVPKDGKIILETTPNGIGGYFYDLFQRAAGYVEGQSEFKVHFFPWFKHPAYRTELTKTEWEKVKAGNYLTAEEKEFAIANNLDYEQMKWRREKKERLGELFDEQYPEDSISCFLGSGHPYFDMKALQKQMVLN